jgi:hypothetical protein
MKWATVRRVTSTNALPRAGLGIWAYIIPGVPLTLHAKLYADRLLRRLF